MPHGHTKFPDKGVCIYCGVADAELSDEHIVPLSIGGQHIIDDASCLKCAVLQKTRTNRAGSTLALGALGSENLAASVLVRQICRGLDRAP
jgi:hypothetical protein